MYKKKVNDIENKGIKKNFEGEKSCIKNRIWKIFIYLGSILKVNFI